MKTDYTKYRFSKKELLLFTAEGIAVCILTDLLFYMNVFAMIPLAFFIPLYLRLRRSSCIKRRQKDLSYDFKEALNSLSVSLRAGYSIENAFVECEKYLASALGTENVLTKEFAYMNRQIRLSTPVETLLQDFAGRTGIENIENFSAVFSAAKRTGGNMGAIIRSAAGHIEGKIEVEKEIEAAIAGKVFEQRIMSAMPFIIILYMRISFPELLSPLYGSIAGAIVMTACLILYAAAFYMGSRIVDIEV